MLSKLVIASQNPDKIEEMQQIFRPLGIQVLSTKDFPELVEVVEDQPTLRGNALKKARYVAAQTKLPALSDDTGLEVEALNGRPGVYSARYAGKHATYQENVEKLLKELKDKPSRKARFRTVVALVDGDQEHTFEGVCPGVILEERKGERGFGYDPVFQPEGYTETFAELDPATKNSISHRGKAVQKFVEFLNQ
jgi:XTP/dITP diphosphohydrolase